VRDYAHKHRRKIADDTAAKKRFVSPMLGYPEERGQFTLKPASKPNSRLAFSLETAAPSSAML
jgi:hypothetical protein